MIIWLASYPKSGNTFLRSLLSSYLLTKDGNFKINSLKKIKQFPSIHLFNKFGIDTSNDLVLVENYIKVQEKLNLLDKQNIRFLKTHSSFHEINGHRFTDLNNTLGVIYVVRDPRTVVKSYANHHQMSLESAVEKLLEFTTLTELTKYSKKTEERQITHVGSWASNYNTWKYFKKLKNSIKSTTFNEMQKLENKEGFYEAVKNADGENVTFFKYGPKKNEPSSLPENLRIKIEKNFKNELEELRYIKFKE